MKTWLLRVFFKEAETGSFLFSWLTSEEVVLALLYIFQHEFREWSNGANLQINLEFKTDPIKSMN